MQVPSRLISSIAALVCLLLGAREVAAKSEFVDVIATHLVLSYQPPCRLCHIQGTTGPGTVQTPFGVSMLARGLTSAGATVAPALDALAADRTDSDGDGQGDIEELLADRDPNTAADVPLGPGGPKYGCAVAAGPWGRCGRGSALLGLVAAIAFARRRSSRDAQAARRAASAAGRRRVSSWNRVRDPLGLHLQEGGPWNHES